MGFVLSAQSVTFLWHKSQLHSHSKFMVSKLSLKNNLNIKKNFSFLSSGLVEKPFLYIEPLSHTTQVLRCNRQLKFEINIRSMPNEIKYLKLDWFKDNDNQTILVGDSRVNMFKYHFNENKINSNGNDPNIIRAGILIQNLVPEDSGVYTVKVSLMNGLLFDNITLHLSVMTCHISINHI